MHVRARPIDPFAGVTHDAELLAAIYPGTDLGNDRRKMPVKTVVGRAAPAMLDDNVPSVVRISCDRVRVDDGAIGDSADGVQRFAVRITLHRLDIDAFMEARVEQADRSF